MRWKRPSRTDLVLTVATLGGLGTLFTALGLTHSGTREWGAGVLVNVGASILLVVPIYLLNRRLDNRIEEVRVETRSSVEALTDRVSSFEHDVERRLDDVAASVATRLEQERQQDIAAFDALANAPTRLVVHEALRRADEMGLISQRRGPRVCVSENWRRYVRIDYDEDPDRFHGFEDITFTVENFDGEALDVIPWPADQDIEEAMVRVGRAVQRVTSGDDLDVKSLLDGLRDVLTVAHTHPDRRPVWQLCPPQWVVTETLVQTYGDAPHYGVSIKNLKIDPHMPRHVSQKTWVDPDSFDEAYAVAIALYEQEQRRLSI
jgi:hypothetical protein